MTSKKNRLLTKDAGLAESPAQESATYGGETRRPESTMLARSQRTTAVQSARRGPNPRMDITLAKGKGRGGQGKVQEVGNRPLAESRKGKLSPESLKTEDAVPATKVRVGAYRASSEWKGGAPLYMHRRKNAWVRKKMPTVERKTETCRDRIGTTWRLGEGLYHRYMPPGKGGKPPISTW